MGRGFVFGASALLRKPWDGLRPRERIRLDGFLHSGRQGARFDIEAVLSYPHLVVSATGQRSAIFDDLLLRQGLRRHALMSVTNFTAVPQLLSHSDMIGVFIKLAADVFHKSFGLAKRPVPIDVGSIATNMVWHVRYDRDRKHAWLRQQIKAIYHGL